MTAVILTAVFLASLYFITKPLFSQNFTDMENENSVETDRETVFLTLNELEFDFRSGKLSLKDYERLDGKYKSLAAELLKNEEKTLINQDDYEQVKEETEKEIEAFISRIKEDKK